MINFIYFVLKTLEILRLLIQKSSAKIILEAPDDLIASFDLKAIRPDVCHLSSEVSFDQPVDVSRCCQAEKQLFCRE